MFLTLKIVLLWTLITHVDNVLKAIYSVIVILDALKMRPTMIMCVVKINTSLTEFVLIVVLLSKIVKNVTMKHVSNVSQNISEKLMAQIAHYVEAQWLDVKNVTTQFSVQDVPMDTLCNKIEMDQLFYLMETVLSVMKIVLLAMRRESIVQAAIQVTHWARQELVFLQTNSISLYCWI